MIRHARPLVTLLAAAALGAAPLAVQAGEISLTVVNVVSPQDVKIWAPTSVVARKGDSVTFRLVNKHADEHGYEIAAFGVKQVVAGDKSATVTFTADKAGIFPIKCHLHPAHVAGQLLVLE
ncbi:MAG: cupredoxin domain-containing protein [Candidatus Rokubacteria bacterium]|nr:cupredoxin domain-containing protein [Candidatus Rokubacteria bacterium]